MKKIILWIIFCAVGICGCRKPEFEKGVFARAEIHAGKDMVKPGDSLPVAIRMTMANGWHTYAEDPGDSGMAPSVRMLIPAGAVAGKWRFPPAQTFKDEAGTTYGYEKNVILLNDVIVPASWREGEALELVFEMDWMICRTECIPLSDTLKLRVQAGAESSGLRQEWTGILKRGGWRSAP